MGYIRSSVIEDYIHTCWIAPALCRHLQDHCKYISAAPTSISQFTSVTHHSVSGRGPTACSYPATIVHTLKRTIATIPRLRDSAFSKEDRHRSPHPSLKPGSLPLLCTEMLPCPSHPQDMPPSKSPPNHQSLPQRPPHPIRTDQNIQK